MFAFSSRTLSATLLLLALVPPSAGCGRTSRDEGLPQPSGTSPSNVTAGATAAGATAGANQAGSAAANGGASSDVSAAGASEITDQPASRSCQEADVPGAPCEDPRCHGARCGVRLELNCEGGAWSNRDSSLAWELVCPASDEPIYDVGDVKAGACCGQLLPKSTQPPSCSLCPEAAPDDGALCSLPDDCAPPLIDCFYKCCCYGNTTWAQCDGKRWHVATNCSAK